MSERSEARAQRQVAFEDKKERRAKKPVDRVSVRFDRWRRIVANLPAGLAGAEVQQMLALVNTRIQHLEGGDGQ
ncbi:MAG: hypothetical protein JWO67_3155 [Streptosporangiaceae bacterium]|nr:hypothetical protein [Streptosporangiaceae bacterium]